MSACFHVLCITAYIQNLHYKEKHFISYLEPLSYYKLQNTPVYFCNPVKVGTSSHDAVVHTVHADTLMCLVDDVSKDAEKPQAIKTTSAKIDLVNLSDIVKECIFLLGNIFKVSYSTSIVELVLIL